MHRRGAGGCRAFNTRELAYKMANNRNGYVCKARWREVSYVCTDVIREALVVRAYEGGGRRVCRVCNREEDVDGNAL